MESLTSGDFGVSEQPAIASNVSPSLIGKKNFFLISYPRHPV